ncbi:MAG: hypothetical protein ACE5IW_10260 [bacterium]
MAQLDRIALKAYFETGDKPTQAQFADLIDSLFALIDNNTVTKVIIANVPIVGDGSGGKILKRGNLVLQMGEYGENDLSITTDDGAFSAGGAAYISDSESALYFDGATRFSSGPGGNIIRYKTGQQIIQSVVDAINKTEIIANGELLICAAADKLAFFSGIPIVKPTITGSRAGNAALTSLLTELDNLGLINNNTTA